MTDITYDAEADAVYITVGRGKVERTEETGPFIYDVDAEGHIVGIEILSASKILAPGDWKSKPAGGSSRQRRRIADRISTPCSDRLLRSQGLGHRAYCRASRSFR
jgi:uncharacterized protein YuzE